MFLFVGLFWVLTLECSIFIIDYPGAFEGTWKGAWADGGWGGGRAADARQDGAGEDGSSGDGMVMVMVMAMRWGSAMGRWIIDAWKDRLQQSFEKSLFSRKKLWDWSWSDEMLRPESTLLTDSCKEITNSNKNGWVCFNIDTWSGQNPDMRDIYVYK